MNLAFFIAKRLSFKAERTFSKLIVRIAILGITLGLCVMLLAIAIMKGFKTEIREKIRGFNGDIQVLKYDLNSSYENSSFNLEKQNLNKIKQLSNVAVVDAFATKPGIIKANDEVEGVVFKGVDSAYHWDNFNKVLIAGKVIDFTKPGHQQQILISELVAKKLNLKVGDNFLMYFIQESLRKRKFEIVGIYRTGVEEVDKIFVIGDMDLVRRLNKWDDNQVGGYELRIKDFNQLDATSYEVGDELPTQLKAVSVTTNFPSIFEWLSLLDINAQVVLVLMLMVAIINMISALLIIILERTHMIGLLKALGESNWGIRKIFLYNAVYLVGFGMLMGNIFGLGLGYIQQQTHFFKLDEASYYMSFIPVQFEWLDIILINIGTLVICLAVLIIPSMLVSKISPVKALSFK
ncbi:ABC transporter permease [Pedobacter puniceum]|uniref:FtsX-like permease family protein n=1 Tax=Pedobacter puniceum TaxID=2666136 RepID=A0A7K0FL38_9SPHI|nr:FtsX-like permease family protein [Pedobacter puniceum]MRX45960.1 FtsX-like permease family protein [Pedobacter puniceum]